MAAKRPIRILCYGDSNTWGTYGHWKDVGKRSLRFAPEDRWPCVMQQELGDGFEVIEEGLGGRTAFADHVDGPWKNGLHTLPTILHSHKPLDAVAIMLGTNDLAQKKDITEDDIYRGACMMVDAVRGEKIHDYHDDPEILLMAPVEVIPSHPMGRTEVYAKFRGDIGRELSVKTAEIYKRVAEEKGCHFLNAQDFAKAGPADGVHMEAEGQRSLGRGVAKYIREHIFTGEKKTVPERMDGSRSLLFMRFDKQGRPAQGMDIFGERMFILHDTGFCAVHDLQTRKPEPLCVFPLASYNEGTPTRDYLNHANHCMFTTVHHEGNPLPLLYVTIGTGIGTDDDGYFYRCAVENVTCTKDAEGREQYQSELLQTITYKPDGIEQTKFMQPCWGCPAFFVDTEKKLLYIFSAKYRTKRGMTPEGEINTYIITTFRLPELSEGAMVRLTPADIIDQFTAQSDVLFTQGGALLDDKIIYTYGCPKAGYPVEVVVFDLKEKRIMTRIGNMDEAFMQEEIECCGLYRGMLLCNTSYGGVFVLQADPYTE